MAERVHTNAAFQRVAEDDPTVAWEFDADDPRVAHLQKKSKAAPEAEPSAPAPQPQRKK